MSTERITLDLTGDDTDGYNKVAPKGWYEGVIYSAEQKATSATSKNPGSPYLKARVNITEEGEFYKHVVWDSFIGLYVTENAPHLANKAKQIARVAGIWDGEDKASVVLPTAEDATGLEVDVLLGQERDTYAEESYEEENGSAPDQPIYRNVVKAYRPRGGWGKGSVGEAVKKSSASGGTKKKAAITL